MRDVILASQNPQAADRIRAVLQSGQIFVTDVYRSGAEVLSFASIRPDAVVICGRMPDMTAATLADTLPNGFDVIWLMPSGAAESGYRSNLIALHMPLNRMELLDTVRMLAAAESEQFSPRKARSAETEAVLQKAKAALMARYSLSEREAHKLLQRRAMGAGQKLLQAAQAVLREANSE